MGAVGAVKCPKDLRLDVLGTSYVSEMSAMNQDPRVKVNPVAETRMPWRQALILSRKIGGGFSPVKDSVAILKMSSKPHFKITDEQRQFKISYFASAAANDEMHNQDSETKC